MPRYRSYSFNVRVCVDLTLSDVVETSWPTLSEQSLADPDESVDAAMDYRLPTDGHPETLRQAQRCLLVYIGWLLDDAWARYPSWAEDELQRALRRLVEVQAATRAVRPRLH
jgi:hypothetical protein